MGEERASEWGTETAQRSCFSPALAGRPVTTARAWRGPSPVGAWRPRWDNPGRSKLSPLSTSAWVHFAAWTIFHLKCAALKTLGWVRPRRPHRPIRRACLDLSAGASLKGLRGEMRWICGPGFFSPPFPHQVHSRKEEVLVGEGCSVRSDTQGTLVISFIYIANNIPPLLRFLAFC